MLRSTLLAFCALFLLPIAGMGQTDTLRIYYDSAWHIISDSSRAEFSRRAVQSEDGNWHVRDFYKNGRLQMDGAFTDKSMSTYQGPFTWYYDDGGVKRKAAYKAGKPVGEDIQYYRNGQMDTYRKYNDQSRQLEEKLYKEDGSQSMVTKAEFPGGVHAMFQFLKKNIRHPGWRSGGKVVMTFIVDKDGSISEIDALEWSSVEVLQEAIRVVSIMPKWTPSTRDQKPVRMRYNLPIAFR